MNKVCTKCNDEKDEEEFPWHKTNVRRKSYCKVCQRLMSAKHYIENKQHYIDEARRRSKISSSNNQENLYEYLKTHPCVDCNEKDPIVLEFDHLEDDKVGNISAMLFSRSWEVIVKEIKKCEVCCANCHRRRTARRGNWFRYSKSVISVH